jgi:lipoprotein NlpI
MLYGWEDMFPRLAFALLLSLTSLPAQTAHQAVEAGMRLFVGGDVAGSILEFERAAKLEPALIPELWQRGISYYYAGRFEDGRKQFEIHRTVNPNDVENAAWWYLCMVKLGRREQARKQLLPVGPDPRIPMAEIYELYAGRGSEQKVMGAVEKGEDSGQPLRVRLFYAHLYLALLADVHGDAKAAARHLKICLDQDTGGYMRAVAVVHEKSMKK